MTIQKPRFYSPDMNEPGNFGYYPKSLGHYIVDYTIPSTGPIAAISATVGWLTYRVTSTYGLAFMGMSVGNNLQESWNGYGELIGNVAKWIGMIGVAVTADDRFPPELAAKVSIGSTLATSFTLNMISRFIFRNNISCTSVIIDEKEQSAPKRLQDTPHEEVQSKEQDNQDIHDIEEKSLGKR